MKVWCSCPYNGSRIPVQKHIGHVCQHRNDPGYDGNSTVCIHYSHRPVRQAEESDIEKKIHKFQLATPTTAIQIPYSGRILYFQCQFGIPTVWVEFDDGDQSKKTERLHIVATGMPFDSSWLYVGTTLDGQFVWHLYSEPVKQEMVH